MQRLFDILLANGATGLDGWTLFKALDVSEDGQWVAGYGINPLGNYEAFLANISPVPIPAVGWLLVPASGALRWLKRKKI
jgi:hypothetical protein